MAEQGFTLANNSSRPALDFKLLRLTLPVFDYEVEV
jgi:hypothetical protein